MKEEYKEFIGIYDESIPVELCNEFVNNYEDAKENNTVVDLSKENEFLLNDNIDPMARKDDVAYVAPLYSTIFPRPPVHTYFNFLLQCLDLYIKRYGIEFEGPIFNDVFKVHKVKKTEGFHKWHYEKNGPGYLERLMAYMTYLEVPTEGGETEFLHQSLRIEPIVGRTLIWPAGYTHMHRGNPPLEGEKMYITGWFTAPRVDFREGVG